MLLNRNFSFFLCYFYFFLLLAWHVHFCVFVLLTFVQKDGHLNLAFLFIDSDFIFILWLIPYILYGLLFIVFLLGAKLLIFAHLVQLVPLLITMRVNSACTVSTTRNRGTTFYTLFVREVLFSAFLLIVFLTTVEERAYVLEHGNRSKFLFKVTFYLITIIFKKDLHA